MFYWYHVKSILFYTYNNNEFTQLLCWAFEDIFFFKNISLLRTLSVLYCTVLLVELVAQMCECVLPVCAYVTQPTVASWPYSHWQTSHSFLNNTVTSRSHSFLYTVLYDILNALTSILTKTYKNEKFNIVRVKLTFTRLTTSEQKSSHLVH